MLFGLLFGIYIDSLLSTITNSKYGCKLGIYKANIVAYADDLVLLAPSSTSLQLFLNEALHEFKRLKLNFNNDKSKWMVFHAPKNDSYALKDMEIDGKPIERINEFKYLGYILLVIQVM